MSELRLRKKPPAGSLPRRRRLEVSRLAHNRAMHYLANHDLTEDERAERGRIDGATKHAANEPYCQVRLDPAD
jgi:hypothetical protein